VVAVAVLIIFGAITLGLTIFDMLALSRGADSRPGFPDDRWVGGYRTF
jgi:hypothetical protein